MAARMPRQKPKAGQEPKTRPCLACGVTFKPATPFYRLCPPCRRLAGYYHDGRC